MNHPLPPVPSPVGQSFDVDSLLERACTATGLSDFGPEPFREPLEVLVECAAGDIDFHEQGPARFENETVRCLANRLRIRRDLQRHPEILEEDVSDPILIMGLGRSGTTKLHKMLSEPSTVQRTAFWRMWNPARFTDSPEAADAEARIEEARASHLMSHDKPDMNAAHHTEQQDVEEEWMLYLLTFDDPMWNQLTLIPSFYEWVSKRPAAGVYAYVKKVLQYLQWQDGGKRGRPWILKSVGYIGNLDLVLEHYPNATLVHPHRDPRITIPSYAKLEMAMWSMYSKNIDPQVAGHETLTMASTAMDRYLEARTRLGLDERIVDVEYEDIRIDPMSVIHRIYERAGRAIDPESERRMATWHDTNEQYQYGRHEYSLAEFGLTEAAIDDAFSDYIPRFIAR
jgi:hypothetical protein